jgi:hypothetical protein
VTIFLVFQNMGKFGIFFLFLSSVNITNFAKKIGITKLGGGGGKKKPWS